MVADPAVQDSKGSTRRVQYLEQSESAGMTVAASVSDVDGICQAGTATRRFARRARSSSSSSVEVRCNGGPP